MNTDKNASANIAGKKSVFICVHPWLKNSAFQLLLFIPVPRAAKYSLSGPREREGEGQGEVGSSSIFALDSMFDVRRWMLDVPHFNSFIRVHLCSSVVKSPA